MTKPVNTRAIELARKLRVAHLERTGKPRTHPSAKEQQHWINTAEDALKHIRYAPSVTFLEEEIKRLKRLSEDRLKAANANLERARAAEKDRDTRLNERDRVFEREVLKLNGRISALCVQTLPNNPTEVDIQKYVDCMHARFPHLGFIVTTRPYGEESVDHNTMYPPAMKGLAELDKDIAKFIDAKSKGDGKKWTQGGIIYDNCDDMPKIKPVRPIGFWEWLFGK